MVCYIVPMVATILLLIGRKTHGMQGMHGFWLNIMFLGGAVFGVVDHFWNSELFLISASWISDLALGGFITAGITTCWGFVVLKPRISHSMHQIACQLGVVKKDAQV